MNPSRADRIGDRQAQILVGILEDAVTAVQAGHPVDSLLSRFYRDHPKYGSRDRRLFSGTIFSVFRWKGWLNIVSPNTGIACVFAHLLESSEVHPAILKLAAEVGLPDVNLIPMGTLPAHEKAQALGQITGHELTLSQLVPSWVLPLLDTADGNRLIEAFQTPPPTWLRTHPKDRETVLAALREQGSEPTAHPTVPSAIAVTRGITLRALPHTIRDQVDVQDLASQVTGLVCGPSAGEKWWDACCGSGGKTLHLAELGGPTSEILATDIRPTILEGLARRLDETRTRNVKATVWDGMTQPPPAGEFDGILLDAPCSGTGTWHRNPDARWRMNPETVTRLVKLQATLLRACATRVKPGGILVYATCSLTQLENEQIVEQFLSDSPGFQLHPFLNPLTQAPCPGQLRILPWDGPCNGMFIARLRRCG